MNVEDLLLHLYEVIKNSGGHLTLREAARCCSNQLRQLEDDNSSRIKRTGSCSSDSSSGADSSCSSGSNRNTRKNDREAANENKLKNLVKYSNKLKLNGNILFANNNNSNNDNIKEYLRPLKNRRIALQEMRRNSLPELYSDSELLMRICENLDSKQEKSDSIANLFGNMIDIKSIVLNSEEELRKLIQRHPSHFNVDGNNVQLKASAFNGESILPDFKNQLKIAVHQSIITEPISNGSQTDGHTPTIPRSYSSDDCNAKDVQPSQNKMASTEQAPSYLATPYMFTNTGATGYPGWPDMDTLSGKYKETDRLSTIMKNFEMDVQMTLDKCLKQMRSELDSIMVEMHRPVDKNLGEGNVFRVDKKWGIIDLGNHDHVFFDMSIMLGTVDDLRNHFQVGEILGFEAVKAQKSSRANWRAIRVWKVDKTQEPRQNNASVNSYQCSYMQKESLEKQKYPNGLGKGFNRFGESSSSKGNSPESSPANSKWRKKPVNPLSKVARENGSSYSVYNGYNRSVCDVFPKSGKTQANGWSHTPLFGRASHPLNSDEIRLIPSKFLCPPEIKKASNSLPTFVPKSLVNLHKNTTTPKLELAKDISGFHRDSGVDSGNNSPVAMQDCKVERLTCTVSCQTDCQAKELEPIK